MIIKCYNQTMSSMTKWLYHITCIHVPGTLIIIPNMAIHTSNTHDVDSGDMILQSIKGHVHQSQIVLLYQVIAQYTQYT